MRYMKCIICLVVLLTVAGVAGFGRANNSPSQEEIAFAKTTSDLLTNEVFAALLKEFGETTPENVEQGKHAISLIFNNANRDIRLIGVFPPLQGGLNDLPSDSFERGSLAKALQGDGNTSVERVGDRWFYRTSIALSNAIHPSCVACHTNFTPQFFEQTHNEGEWVGALTLRVPIDTD
ncbi:MAG TPA: hypothetical protein VGV87_19725 [Blastocatellia bacterium]|jgi:hypothetical protein|nr:hypothetical protein [Blastocatellia bacterium]